MSEGCQRHARGLLVAQAALVWTNASKKTLERYIDTGHLDDSGKADVEPYNADVVKQILATGQGL